MGAGEGEARCRSRARRSQGRFAMYDFDNKTAYVEDCPKCKHTMQRLAEYNSVRRNEGYSLDDGKGDSNAFVYFFFGWIGVLIRLLTREVLVPLMKKAFGEQKQSRYDNILKAYPNSLLCPHCKHLIRRKGVLPHE